MKSVKDKHLVSRIEELRKAIRRKYRLFKQGIVDTEQTLEKRYKPLLSEIRKTSKRKTAGVKKEKNVKEEKKEEDEEEEEEEVIEDSEIDMEPDQEFKPAVYSSPLVPQRSEQVFETTPPDLTTVLSTPEGVETASRYVEETFQHPYTREYMLLMFKDKGNRIDNIYGPRVENDTLMLGNKPLNFDEDGNILSDNIRYKGTKGLYELIFKRVPDDHEYDEKDLDMYKKILVATSAHRKDFNPKGKVKRSTGATKYKAVIKELFPTQLYGGRGMITKIVSPSPELSYWDNPNELCERLAVLVASAEVGNNAHRNEVISIIEELREAGYVSGRGNSRYRTLISVT